MKTKLFISGLAFFAFTVVGIAQDAQKPGQAQNSNAKGIAYVDDNKDGVCDNYVKRKANAPYGKRNGNCPGNGQGMRQGQPGNCGQGKGKNFIDENKNGVCDLYEDRTKK